MKELTLQNFKETVNSPIPFQNWSDEKLLKAHLDHDLELDSMEVIDLIAEFEVKYDVIIDTIKFDEITYPAAIEKDVATLLKVCNECMRPAHPQ